MQITSSDKPSAASTVVIAIAGYLITIPLIYMFLVIWMAEPWDAYYWTGKPYWGLPMDRMHITTRFGFTGGLIGAIVAAWAWRSSTTVRFHCCYWSGLFSFSLSLVYVLQISRAAAGFYDGPQFRIAPHLSTFTVALGLILLITAIHLDRSPSARRPIA
jgi:hypothetical protein